MDIRELLKKYIAHVGEREGSTCLGRVDKANTVIPFTEEEWDTLKSLEAADYTIEGDIKQEPIYPSNLDITDRWYPR